MLHTFFGWVFGFTAKKYIAFSVSNKSPFTVSSVHGKSIFSKNEKFKNIKNKNFPFFLTFNNNFLFRNCFPKFM